MNNEQEIACCAHSKVSYKQIVYPGGKFADTCSDSWSCSDCGMKFWPETWTRSRAKNEAEEALQKYHQILVMLKRDLDQHVSDNNKLELSKAAWNEAVSRVETIQAAMKKESK